MTLIVLKSVYIKPEQDSWVKQHHVNLSRFVRDAITRAMQDSQM